MEQSMKKQHWSVAVIALAIGLILGAFLYSRIIGRASISQTPTVNVVAEQFVHEGILPDVVRISPGAQKEMGITVETATLRNLQDTLSATGTVREDPGLVAHIRPLARGLIEKTYVRLGDRVSGGEPLLEYDNIEMGLAVGEYQSVQAELVHRARLSTTPDRALPAGTGILNVGTTGSRAPQGPLAPGQTVGLPSPGRSPRQSRSTLRYRRQGRSGLRTENHPARNG